MSRREKVILDMARAPASRREMSEALNQSGEIH